MTAPLAGRRIVVTGGSGFIGSHVVRALRSDGADVVVADLLPSPDADVTVVQVDLRAPGAVAHVVQPGVDTIVHLAAATSVLRSIDRPAETVATNVSVTAELLEHGRQCGVTTFVFASTNAVVGPARHFPIHEGTPLAPLTPYGATKAAAEMLLSTYNAVYAVRSSWLRLTNVYGPGMGHKDSVIPRLLKAAGAGATFEVYGDGDQLRDYVYVSDVVSAVRLAVADGRWAGPVVIGSGVSTSVLDLAGMVREVTGVDLPLRHVPAKPGEMPKVSVDVGHARSLGWQPVTLLPEGLKQVWKAWPGGRHVAAPVSARAGVGR
ncbi:MAG: NAD-dependent epimerase/dehydratase family protein [Actinomycetota bacterium]|nr:NAD-dependent epimerase/dehydratase family protein [Actinomycetota bacterium]